MKKKNIIIVGSIVLLVLIVLVSVLVVNKIDSDKELKRQGETIVNDYETFKGNVEKLNEFRTHYQNDIVVNQFVETVKDEYETWVLELDEYTELIDKVSDSTENLEKLCKNNYSDKNVSNKCDAYIDAYEKVINYYINDVNSFNSIVKEYKEENKKSEIKEYELKYDYIDVNKDDKFEGKN